LYATLDPERAALGGVPVRLLGVAFLGLIAVVTAESAQAVGTLLLLGLIAAPAGAAHRLTCRPWRGFVLSAAIAAGAMWSGLALAYAVATIPPSTAIVGFAALTYLLAAGYGRLVRGSLRV
jgi:zinc/manganese transport system permease protein